VFPGPERGRIERDPKRGNAHRQKKLKVRPLKTIVKVKLMEGEVFPGPKSVNITFTLVEYNGVWF
jgi:hypothetical protein